MKTSRIRRLVPKKLARQLADSGGDPAITALVESESADVIAKMRSRGYTLATRLETGEGVFVREVETVGLHVQLPRALYRKLETECKRREISKKRLVVEALEVHFGEQV